MAHRPEACQRRGTAANELHPGLDHLAFACADRFDVETWRQRLDDLGIENGGIVDASYGSGVSFRDPDNIPLEFFARWGDGTSVVTETQPITAFW